MQTITLRGKTYPIYNTMGASVRFKRRFYCDISEMKDGDIEQTCYFMYACMLSACNAEGVEVEIDFDTFADLLQPADVANFFNDMAKEAQGVQKKTPKAHP